MNHSVFILGPGHWAGERPGVTPLQVRRMVAAAVRNAHRDAYLMEDRDPLKPRNVARKFLGLLAEATHVWIVWPTGARMATTAGEMNHLRFLMEADGCPPVTVFYQDDTAEVRAGVLYCIDQDAKNAYLQDLFEQKQVRPIPWKDVGELMDQAVKVAEDLDST